jgi:hypothetical protein
MACRAVPWSHEVGGHHRLVIRLEGVERAERRRHERGEEEDANPRLVDAD